MTTRRFLAPQARAGDGHGYLSQPGRPYPQAPDPPELIIRIITCTALCDEPEAPSPHWLNSEAELAAERNRLRHLREVEIRVQMRQHLTDEDRIRNLRHHAKRRHVDITMELYLVRKGLARGNRDELERAEARLDGL